MGRKDWYYVHLPKLLIKRLDQFLQTPRAKSMGMSSKPELLRHVINQFLDEQEALYNKMDYVSDIILETKDRLESNSHQIACGTEWTCTMGNVKYSTDTIDMTLLHKV